MKGREEKWKVRRFVSNADTKVQNTRVVNVHCQSTQSADRNSRLLAAISTQSPCLPDFGGYLPLRVVPDMCLFLFDPGKLLCPAGILHESQIERSRAEGFFDHDAPNRCWWLLVSRDGLDPRQP